MIIVQNKEKDIIGLYSTIRKFLEHEDGVGRSYNYVQGLLKDAEGKTVKYKKFFITKRSPVTGRKSTKGAGKGDKEQKIGNIFNF